MQSVLDHLDRRVEHGLVVDGALVGVAVADVDPVELRGHRVLAHERLHDGDAVDLLVQERVEPRRASAHVAVRRARALADVVDDGAHDRQREKRHDRHAPVEHEHHRDDADEGDDVPHRVERARGEQLAHGVDVVGRARDEAPDRRSIVVAQAQALEEAEDRRCAGRPSRARPAICIAYICTNVSACVTTRRPARTSAVAHQPAARRASSPGARRRP